MRALDGELMLVAWERSRDRPEQEGALALLELAAPEQPFDELAILPLAERNALLLELRAITLGRRMEGFATCPDCGAQLEFAVDPRELATGLSAPPPELIDESAGLTMRPANTRDLLACLEAGDDDEACSILLARTLGIEKLDARRSAQKWPQSLFDRFDAMNATAEIRVQLLCASCRGRQLLDLDIARFIVREVALAARRLMADIHALATAYGWSERAIAAMSGARRAAYLEMLSE